VQYFLGRFDYAMDARGRLPVPPRYRDAFALGAVLSQGLPEPCLRLYTAQSFEQQAALYTSEPATRRAGRVTRHAFFARSFSVDLDRQGRILVPAPLRAFAGLEGNVTVVGGGEWLELWDPGRFDVEMAAVDGELESTLEAVEPRP
jgi:MraZ protein